MLLYCVHKVCTKNETDNLLYALFLRCCTRKNAYLPSMLIVHTIGQIDIYECKTGTPIFA